MSAPETPDEKQPKSSAMPRWQGRIIFLLTWVMGFPLAHGVLPWAISLLMPTYGWREGSPGVWNWLGLIPIGAATIWLIWIMPLHFSHIPERVEMGMTPFNLISQGPYRFTRNPMYVAELALWLGWTILFGSVAVLIALALWWAVFQFINIPREERALEAKFGEAYRQYMAAVPRWLGMPRR